MVRRRAAHPRPGPLPSSIVALGMVALALLLPRGVRAGEVVVVRGSDLPAYKAVETAFTAALGSPARALSLTDGDAGAALKGAGLIFAIGPDAAKAASAAVAAAAKPAALLVALVPSADKAGLDPRIPLMPMFVTPARQARVFKSVLPGLKTVGLLYDPAQSRALAAECEAAAGQAGIALIKAPVAPRQDVAGAARGLLSQVGALWLIPDTTVVSAETFKFLVQASVAQKVPLLGFSEGMAKAGALVTVEAGYAEIGRRAAASAKRLQDGAAAAPEAPDGSVFLNAKSAELLGVELSAAARSKATKVFE